MWRKSNFGPSSGSLALQQLVSPLISTSSFFCCSQVILAFPQHWKASHLIREGSSQRIGNREQIWSALALSLSLTPRRYDRWGKEVTTVPVSRTTGSSLLRSSWKNSWLANQHSKRPPGLFHLSALPFSFPSPKKAQNEEGDLAVHGLLGQTTEGEGSSVALRVVAADSSSLCCGESE